MARTTKIKRAVSERGWLVRLLGLLLLLQTVGLSSLGAFHLISLGPLGALNPQILIPEMPRVLLGTAFNLLALLTLLTAISFLRVQRRAWLYAMLVQGFTLLLALNLYLRGRPAYAYGMMLYGIFMVIYLNFSEVQLAFRPKPQSLDRAQDQ